VRSRRMPVNGRPERSLSASLRTSAPLSTSLCARIVFACVWNNETSVLAQTLRRRSGQVRGGAEKTGEDEEENRHLHPAKLHPMGLRIRHTFCLGGITLFLFIISEGRRPGIFLENGSST